MSDDYFYEEDHRTAHDKIRAVVMAPSIDTGVNAGIREMLFRYALEDPTKSILLYNTSYGGDIFEAIAIGDAIAAVKGLLVPPALVYGIASGYCMSAATYILQFCDVRKMTKNSYLMVHGITQNRFGPSDERTSKRDHELMQQLRAAWVEVYMKRGKKPKKYWDEIMQSNAQNFFTAAEALEVGLIDEIIDVTPFVDKSIRGRKRVASIPERSLLPTVQVAPKRRVKKPVSITPNIDIDGMPSSDFP